jgi:3-oxoacyl-[acyl-carrier-protein] synthase II
MKDIFITGLGNVSPQKTFDNTNFLEEVIYTYANRLRCQDPNYKEFVPADMLRRMSRIIRFGVVAGKICLADSGCSMPDAILTGTGLGCIEDTEKFLSNLIRSKEELLTPTSFIQSTHNTVSAQIALLLKCHNYNFTYVHRGLSFECALLDSLLQLEAREVKTVLLGGMDEMTDNTVQILQRLGQMRSEPVETSKLFDTVARGSIAGEGAAFFLLSQEPSVNNYARISGLEFFYNTSSEEISRRLAGFLQRSGKSNGDIDLVLLGRNGDEKTDATYGDFEKRNFPGTAKGVYKHLCGEYFTSSAFGLWLAARILYHQRIPDAVLSGSGHPAKVRNILLYNHFRNSEHSFILVTAA